MGKVQKLYQYPEGAFFSQEKKMPIFPCDLSIPQSERSKIFPACTVYSSVRKIKDFSSLENRNCLKSETETESAGCQPISSSLGAVASSCQGSQFTSSCSALFHSCLESMTMLLSHGNSYQSHFYA